MRISELAARSGVSVDRLRRYEAAGLIHASRSRGNYREFDERVLREVTFIAMSRELGLSLAEIAGWLPRYRSGRLSIDEMIDGLNDRIAAVDREIAAQQAMRARLVSHVAWFEERKRRAAEAANSTPAPAWPGSERRTTRRAR